MRYRIYFLFLYSVLLFSKLSLIISFTFRIFDVKRKQFYVYCEWSGIECHLVREKKLWHFIVMGLNVQRIEALSQC